MRLLPYLRTMAGAAAISLLLPARPCGGPGAADRLAQPVHRRAAAASGRAGEGRLRHVALAQPGRLERAQTSPSEYRSIMGSPSRSSPPIPTSCWPAPSRPASPSACSSARRSRSSNSACRAASTRSASRSATSRALVQAEERGRAADRRDRSARRCGCSQAARHAADRGRAQSERRHGRAGHARRSGHDARRGSTTSRRDCASTTMARSRSRSSRCMRSTC